MGRPGGQDVIAEELYFAATSGSRGAAFTDAATYDAQYRPLALAPTIALEQAAMVANPNLRYFNWKAEYGHTMVFLRPDRGIIECWQVPQRERSDGRDAARAVPHDGRCAAPDREPRRLSGEGARPGPAGAAGGHGAGRAPLRSHLT